MRTKVYRACRGVPAIGRLSARDGPFTGSYCARANAEIAEEFLEHNVAPAGAVREAEEYERVAASRAGGPG